MGTILIVLIGILILGGSLHKNFQPKDSTCKKNYKKFKKLYFKDKNYLSKYSREELIELRDIANDCKKDASLSTKDYAKYIELLNSTKILNKEADKIIKRGKQIHSQRIRVYD